MSDDARLSVIRRRAEALAQSRLLKEARDESPLSAQQARAAVYELHVHQIELEMQNEELRRKELELQEERTRYFDLYEMAPVGYCIIDEGGRIAQANLTSTRLLGVPRSALIGKQMSSFILKDDQDIFFRLRQQLAAGAAARSCELRVLSGASGSVLWLELAFGTTENVDGKPAWRMVLSDISVRKSADLKLRASEEKLRGLFDLSPLGIAMADIEGRFVDFNDAFCRLCGYSGEELQVLGYWALTPERYAVQETAQLELIRRSGHFGPYEKRYLRKDGCEVPVLLSGVLIIGDDGREYIWCVVEDISARKETEQLQMVLNDYHELSLGQMAQKREKMVSALTMLSMYRDNETGQHLTRTQLYVKALAQALARSGRYPDLLDEAHIEQIVKAAPMHDLGKVGIPDQILLKPGRHTPEETTVMQTHAAIGESILVVAAGGGDDSDTLLLVASRIAGSHHENWDGSGYPRGLKGLDIPLEARLMALVDVYDALTTPRVYKPAWAHEIASAEILKLKGVKFEPAIVDAFQSQGEAFQAIQEQLSDPA